MIIGVNTGGTFTDFVYKQGDTWGVYKVLSTPSNFAEAVLNGLNYFSYVNPCHEQKVRELLAPFGLELSLSHEILAEFREFERTSTTVINAYVSPKTKRYIGHLIKKLGRKDSLGIMQSNGGSISAETAMNESVRTILSGPAGGAVGAYEIGKMAGYSKLISFDMGGTSTDVSLIDGNLSLAFKTNISGYPVKVPMIDIHTVGAGGGSIASFDEGGALSKALPHAIPAAAQGTMNNVAIGAMDFRKGKPFAYYETIGGGMDASAKGRGESAVHSHMTNTLNTPIEALEYSYPFLVTEYSIRRGTGGQGLHRGGDGIVREIELLWEADVTVLSERRKTPPYGLFGGAPGAVGKNVLIRKNRVEEKGSKFSASLKKGDRLRIETPGGGGWGETA
ncbi:MAG: hydantoinase B/oxoprolinase family protein [Desulfobacterales bacterium]